MPPVRKEKSSWAELLFSFDSAILLRGSKITWKVLEPPLFRKALGRVKAYVVSARHAWRTVNSVVLVPPWVRIMRISIGSLVILPGLLTPTRSTKLAEAAVTGPCPATGAMDSVAELATKSGKAGEYRAMVGSPCQLVHSSCSMPALV